MGTVSLILYAEAARAFPLLARLARKATMKRRLVERSKPVVTQPAQIAVEKGTQVRNAVFQHRYAVDPHAKGKALVRLRINAPCGQDFGMHHAAAEDLKPSSPSPTLLPFIPRTSKVHLSRGLSEGKM